MKLSELATIIPGFSPLPDERKKTGAFLLLGGRNIQSGQLVLTSQDAYVGNIQRGSFNRAIAKSGDIIVSTLFKDRKLYVYKQGDPKAVVNNSCAIIRAPENNDYISSYLRTWKGQSEFLKHASDATSKALIPRLSTKDLSEIDIPILPIEELQQLGDAHIEASPDDKLEALKEFLLSRLSEFKKSGFNFDEAKFYVKEGTQIPDDAALNRVRVLYQESPIDKDAEIQRLKARLAEMEQFFNDRIAAITAQLTTNKLAAKIQHGETTNLEFKSTLRRNLKTNEFDSKIENAVLKTIVAFCNTNGGELLIGIADNKTVLGIDADGFPNTDKFLLHLRNLLSDRIKPSILQYVEYDIENIEGKNICVVKCKKSTEAMWLKSDGEHFYIRSGPSSTELPPSEAAQYIVRQFRTIN